MSWQLRGYFAFKIRNGHILSRLVVFSIVVGLGFVASGCSKYGDLSRFIEQLPGVGGTSLAGLTQALIINAPGGYDVNNDLSNVCVATVGVDRMLNGGATLSGCMQPAATTHAGERWFVGFPQFYGAHSTATLQGFSAMVNVSSATTGLFGSVVGDGLAVIDPGNGQTNPPTTSARYIEFGKLSNGNVIAVYWLDDSGTSTQKVYATVYDIIAGSWGTPQQLDGNAATEFGSDFTAQGGDYNSIFCRPKIATSGDGTAMVAWCEGATSVIRYAVYSNGGWSASSDLVSAATSNYIYPGFHQDSRVFTTAAGTSSVLFSSGDQVSVSVTHGLVTDVATATAVNASPGAGQFLLVKNSSGTVLMCNTLQNLTQALLSVTTNNSTTLGELGLSMKVNSLCSESDATTRAITTFYNRDQKAIFRDVTSITDYYINPMEYTASGATSSTSLDAAFGGAGAYPLTTDTDHTWNRSGAVDLAADDYGNYALVRSVPSVVFRNDISSSQGILHARQLVGHQYSSGGGWSQTNSILDTKFVSKTPACLDNNNHYYFPCSIKNPKVLLSPSGKGLVLFYQKQLEKMPTSSTTKTNQPTRLWVSTYSTSTGYSGDAHILDQDTVCSNSSAANDASVCETGAFSTNDSTLRCQNLDKMSVVAGAGNENTYLEDSLTTKPITNGTTDGFLTHDIAPIAASMNEYGQAIVVYHKKVNSGTLLEPVCDTVGTFASIYDPVNGFGDVVQLDDSLGDGMHAHVAINKHGTIAVVWEQMVGGYTYVYLKRYQGGTWHSQVIMNEGMISPRHSMLPSVTINDRNVILVSFTYGENGSKRAQYARMYYAN